MNNVMKSITQEIANVDATPSTSTNVGMYTGRKFYDVIVEAQKRPDPRQLYECFWYEGEVSCLFADSNLGKSILAVEIAQKIAADGTPVQFFDFELSDKQLQLRYTSQDGNVFHFNDNMQRVTINREMLGNDASADELSDLEKFVEASGCRVVIVDNLTWLCGSSEKGEDAATLMRRLVQLKFKYELSMLIIAHTPKRDMSRPITANDLAGSRKLFNFFDSVFAIGRSARDENLRYIKQVKCRYGEFTYDADNVIVCSIEKNEDGFLHFARRGYERESEHLKELSDNDHARFAEECRRLAGEGRSLRAIASEMNLSVSKVRRLLGKLK